MESKKEVLDYEDVERDNTNISTEDRNSSGQQKENLATTSFKELIQKPELFKAIQDSGFENPSEVQQDAIPSIKSGNDLLCQAKSGMGKTSVFVLSTLDMIEKDQKPFSVIVLEPTRELAIQTKNEYIRFSTGIKDLKIAVL